MVINLQLIQQFDSRSRASIRVYGEGGNVIASEIPVLNAKIPDIVSPRP